MKPCPDCDTPLAEKAVACACGWKAQKPAPAGKAADPDFDPDHAWRCSHTLLGQRCNEPGAYKRGDKWYCATHAGKKPLDELSRAAGEQGLTRARSILANAKPLARRYGDMGARRVGEIVTPADVARARFTTTGDAGAFDNDLPWEDGRE